MEQAIINNVIEHLEKNTSLSAKWEEKQQNGIDGFLTLEKEHVKLKFPTEVKKEIRNHHLAGLLKLKKKNSKLLIIAHILPEQIKQILKTNNIAYLDGAGNTFIQEPELYILIEGKKHQRDPKKLRHRAFTKTGLKIIFHFLLNDELINQTYRNIAAIAGVSLDAVSKTLTSLKELGFMIKLDKKRWKLVRKKDLLNRWIYQYGDKLKPSLHIGNFRSIDNNWKKIEIDSKDSQWGGEPGGDLLTNYLQPEILTLYTDLSRLALIKRYRWAPSQKGDIEVYQKFWGALENRKDKMVPPVLVYADLVYSGDSRNLETAQRIYEQYLQNEFQ